jgi:molybdopterin synthase catalytic subunit
VGWHGSRRIGAGVYSVVVGPLTPLHERERLPSQSPQWASPGSSGVAGLSGGLRWVVVRPPASGTSWLSLTDDVLPIAAAYEWAVVPNCGAVVLFSGTVRDHAVDEQGVLRDQVETLAYEAYESQVVPRFEAIEAEMRLRWPETGRVVLIHRTGSLKLGESSVIAVVSAPHRGGAFEAARYAIDALKVSAPIWKREVWRDGADWGTAAHAPVDAAAAPTSSGRRNSP